jgi:hypothetical protein
MLRTFTLSVALLFTITITGIAQIRLSGTIMDASTNKPIDFANVALLQQDSTFVSGIETDAKGKFRFTNISKGNYILSTSFMGYDRSNVLIDNLEKDTDLGEIILTTSDVSLNDVTITGNSVIRKPDRQIILPTQAQINASSNGVTLLRNLQLHRIIINPMDNSITTPGGGSVQLRINGVEVSQAEITALNPTDIIRIEYHDDPGMRYNNAAAVLDYIVRQRESGGNVNGNLANAIADMGWGENYLAAKYNYKKSEFSTNVYWSHRKLEWTRENHETFVFPNEVLQRIEQGEPTTVKFGNVNASLNYNLQETDKYLFNVRFRNNYNYTPNDFNDRISTICQNNSPLSIYDHTSAYSNSPSLDIYYQRNLKNNQLLIFNMVGTYIDSKNTRTYQENRANEITTDIYSRIRGDKYSLIGEGIYEKSLNNGKISGGIKHTQTYTQNTYLGDVDTNIGMNTAETYAYIEYQLKQGKFNYMFGIGGMRTYNSQGSESNEKFIFRPTLRVTYNINENFFIRYNGYISGYAPSLSDLNNVEQSIDSLQIRRGNPGLKTVTFYSNTLTASWNKGIFGAEIYAHYNYDSKPIMENISFENGKFIRTTDNQKSFHRMRIQTSLRLKPFKDYITISARPWINRYISNGNDYVHTHTNWGYSLSFSGNYKKWYANAEVYSRYNNLWGETFNRGERFHLIGAGYNAGKWNVGLMMLNPFSKDYEIGNSGRSHLAPNKQIAYSDKLAQIFVVNVSINLDFGRQYKAGQKRLQNEDTDSGVLSGKK